MEPKEIRNINYKKSHTFDNPNFYIRLNDPEILDQKTEEEYKRILKALGKYGLSAYISYKKASQAESAHCAIKNCLNAAFDKNNDDSIISKLASRYNLPNDVETEIDFINYGSTQMVYLANMANGDTKQEATILINQPNVNTQTIENEYINLQRLHDIDPRFVVEPLAYFSDKTHSLYASEYIEKARCIFFNDQDWGVYDPVPKYHFEPFTEAVSSEVCSAMIAILINYYDEKSGLGIAHTQLCGNDFILSQNCDINDPNSILDNIKLIAARETIKIPLTDYIRLIKSEFMFGVSHRLKPGDGKISYAINHGSETPINRTSLENGIGLGLKLRSDRDLLN